MNQHAGSADAPSSLTIVDLTEPGERSALLREAFDTVLRPSFTPDELASLHDITPGDGRVVTLALDASNAVVGGAVSEIVPDGVSILTYLAVGPLGRGRGVGAALLAHLQELWSQAGCALVVAEVHDPRGHSESDDEHPADRLRFYARAGARVLDVPWVQPALAPGLHRVRDMLLLVMYREGGDVVPAAAMRDWAAEYFLEAEGAVPSDAERDPQGVALLTAIGSRGSLRILPIERWDEVTRLSDPSATPAD